MTIIDNTEVRWDLSPRLFWIPEAIDNPTIQDIIDTARKVHEHNLMNLDKVSHLVDAAGKEALGGGTIVGITATGRNMQIAFNYNPTPASIGTITTPDTTGLTLIDSAGDFVNEGVEPGAWIVNLTDVSISAVITVDSPTQISCLALGGGSDNQWDSSDAYVIWNVTQKTLLGGNFVSVDELGADISAVFTTPLTQVITARSSAATQAELAEIRLGSFDGVVSVNADSGITGTAYPRGNKANKVNNIPDAVAIAIQPDKGFDTLEITGDFTFDTGDNLTDYIVEGRSPAKSTFTVNTGSVVLRTIWKYAKMSGVFDNQTEFTDCHLTGTIQFVEAQIMHCVLEPSLEMTLSGSNPTLLESCISGMDSGTAPTINMGGSGRNLGIRRYSGAIKITNLTGDNLCDIHISEGKLIIDSTCTAGTINVWGDIEVVDNSGVGCIVNQESSTLTLLKRLLGLSHENHYIDQMVYTNGRLTSSRTRIYSSAGSVGTDNNVTATYVMTATYSGEDVDSFAVVKQ